MVVMVKKRFASVRKTAAKSYSLRTTAFFCSRQQSLNPFCRLKGFWPKLLSAILIRNSSCCEYREQRAQELISSGLAAAAVCGLLETTSPTWPCKGRRAMPTSTPEGVLLREEVITAGSTRTAIGQKESSTELVVLAAAGALALALLASSRASRCKTLIR
eukprot:scaffold130888_cov63-Phaeocystis_antarctica.AAC.4